MAKPNMVYTPKNHIPIGEAVKKPDGTLALRIKKTNSNKYDEITMDTLYQAVVKQAAPVSFAETRILAGTRITIE